MHFRRTVVEDTELRGQELKKGDKVVLWYVSANFDEDQFNDPYDLPSRTDRPTTTSPSDCTARTSVSGRTSRDSSFA